MRGNQPGRRPGRFAAFRARSGRLRDLRLGQTAAGTWNLVNSASGCARDCRKEERLRPRSEKTPARVPGDLVSKVEQQVRKTKLDRLGLARRSGALIVGTEKTRDKLRQGKLALLVLASDGSPQTTAPLIHLAGQTGTEVLVSESAETLAQALGRATAVCSGVLDARMAATILADHALHSGVGLSPDPTVAEAAS